MKLLAALLALTIATPGTAQIALGDTRFEAFAVDETRSKPRRIRDGDRVEHRVGTSCYKWQLTFSPTQQNVVLHETLTLPGPAPAWGDTSATTVARNKRSAETVIDVDGSSGQASNMWCVAAGDPQGLHRIDVRQDGRSVGSVTFYLKKNW